MCRGTIFNRVKTRIERGGPGKLWTYADFVSLPATAVAASLSRLARRGTIDRVRKGVYYKPRETRFGRTAPEASEVAAAVLTSRGVAWKHSGLPAYNSLGLTTQVSAVPTFAVDREVTSLRTGAGRRVRVRSVGAVKNASPEERIVLDALRDLKSIPDTSPAETLGKIIELFREGRVAYDRVVRLCAAEPPRVKALLGVIGTVLSESPERLRALKGSLNPTTSFNLGIADSFPAAREWRVR